MNYYRSKRWVLMLLDILAISLSFVTAAAIRFGLLIEYLGSEFFLSYHVTFLGVALFMYVAVSLSKPRLHIEQQSNREIVLMTLGQQCIFIAFYVFFFFVFKKTDIISRVVIGLFFVGNIIYCSIARILYHKYCIKKAYEGADEDVSSIYKGNSERNSVRHVYIIGSKSIGQYGGYESFVMNLLQQHKDESGVKYHIACKANGSGFMDLSKLPGSVRINDSEFTYCNAHCFMISIPEKMGAAQAITYDIKALEYACNHIEKNHIDSPIVYILASRIGPFERKYVECVHDYGGIVLQNPDGHENWRRKWNYLIRQYWKYSEEKSVKYADLVVCDSKNIESYIREEYAHLRPKTTFIAYGSHILPSAMEDNDETYVNWLTDHDLKAGEFFISVGRFVPENNFDIMIREFMRSKTTKDFAIITNENEKYEKELQQKLQYKKDKRIKFVGTVYAPDLLGKIRADACGYFHGHEVGGTNPSLLEALGTTDMNLLYDVGFNREVAEDSAVYWTKEDGNLAELINKVDRMPKSERQAYGEKAKKRIREEYSWKKISDQYLDIWLGR